MIPSLVALGTEFIAASQFKQRVDVAYTTAAAERVVGNDDYPIWMAWTWHDGVHNAIAQGFIIGSVSQMMFSPALMACEEATYVRKEAPFRGMIANRLMQSLQRWAFDDKKAELFRAGESSGINPRAADHFMRRNGMKKVGTIYSKDAE